MGYPTMEINALGLIERAKRGAEGRMGQAQEEQTDVKALAKEALRKNELEEQNRYKTEDETQKRIMHLEMLRNDVATLENFVNDPTNEEIVENSPELMAHLIKAKKTLEEDEHALQEGGFQMATSIKGMETNVREEMSLQYLLANNPDLVEAKKRARWEKVKLQYPSNFEKAYSQVDDALDRLPFAFEESDRRGIEISDSMRRRILGELSKEPTMAIKEIKKESKGDFDSDYTEWKNFHASLHGLAGVQPPGDRTDKNIVIPGLPLEFSFGVFTSANPVMSLKELDLRNQRYLDSLENALSISEKTISAKGFVGVRTLKKKTEILRSIDLRFDQDFQRIRIDTNNVEDLNAGVSALIDRLSEKKKKGLLMKYVCEQAIREFPDIEPVIKRTPVASMWKVELQQHVQTKIAELEKIT